LPKPIDLCSPYFSQKCWSDRGSFQFGRMLRMTGAAE
jgi:hypothetical protein